MQRSIILSVALLSAPLTTLAADDNPVLGEFSWSPTSAICPETHIYRADGTKTGTSGDEVLGKTYTIEAVGGGMYRLQETVTATNGGKDCQGGTTAVGARSTIYIMPLNGGGFFTCASEDTLTCYGSAAPRKPPATGD